MLILVTDLLVLYIAQKIIGNKSVIGIGYYGCKTPGIRVFTTRYVTVEVTVADNGEIPYAA